MDVFKRISNEIDGQQCDAANNFPKNVQPFITPRLTKGMFRTISTVEKTVGYSSQDLYLIIRFLGAAHIGGGQCTRVKHG